MERATCEATTPEFGLCWFLRGHCGIKGCGSRSLGCVALRVSYESSLILCCRSSLILLSTRSGANWSNALRQEVYQVY
jgi:hypothetical protein